MSSRSSEHYHCTSFDYLGFTFRPRATKDKRNNVLFTSYLPAISKKSVSSIHETIKSWNLKCLHNRSLRFVASYINDVVRGWINYYGKFGKTEFWKVMFHLNRSIAYWAKTKYKRFRRRGVISAHYWLAGISQKAPNLFYHWQVGYVPYAHRKKWFECEESYEGRLSRTVPREAEGEIPLVYSTKCNPANSFIEKKLLVLRESWCGRKHSCYMFITGIMQSIAS